MNISQNRYYSTVYAKILEHMNLGPSWERILENGGKISRDTVPLNIHMLTKSYRFASSTFTRAEERVQPVTK